MNPDEPTLFDLEPAPSDDSLDVAPEAPEPAWSDPLLDDTDLPVALRGTSGNHDAEAEHVVQLLRDAGVGLDTIVDLLTNAAPAPPLSTTDPVEVRRWLDMATHRILDYHTSLQVRRGVLDALDAQFHLEYHARQHAERVARRARDHTAKAAGTYWRDRDARRTATRPVHIEVDFEVWAELKRDTIRRRSTVGALVNAEVKRRGQTLCQTGGETSAGWSDGRTAPPTGRRAPVFARIAVDDGTWAEFRALVEAADMTTARALALLVEQVVAGGTSPP